MSLDHAYQDQELAGDVAGSAVTRVQIFASPLVRMGLEQILHGTRFVVRDTALQDMPQSCALGPAAQLSLVDERYRPHAIPELISDLKAQNSAGRIVLLADQ